MRTVYRTYFELAEKENPTLESVRDVVLCWALARKGAAIPKDVDLTGDSGLKEIEKGFSVESRQYTGTSGNAWGLRLINPDQEPDVYWASETSVHKNLTGNIWVSCSLQVGRNSESLSPVIRSANRPGVVGKILSKYPGKGILQLTPNPFGCAPEQAQLLLCLLESPERHHPVVFISTTRDGKCLCDGKKLADHLCGLAYVVVGKSDELSGRLGEVIPDRLNCFDGGVRIYWPGFKRNSHPMEHPLWIRSKIQALNAQHPSRLGSEILNRIASVSAFTSSQFFVSWSKIVEWQRAEAIEQARANNDQGAMVELFVQTNKNLQYEVRQLKEALEAKAQEAVKYKNLAETFRSALESGNRTTAKESLESGIETVADALTVAEKEFSDKLIFCWNCKSDGADSPFEKPDEVLAVLRWLATTYYDARIGKKACPDFEQSVRETVEGWSYEPHQSKGTMNNRKLWDWYHTTHNTVEYSLPEHLKCGTKKDARHSIRIAFTWESMSKKVILGYLGQHQQNSSS